MLSFQNFDKYIVKCNLITKLNTYNYKYFNTLKSVFLFFKNINIEFIRIKYSILPKMNTFLSYYQSKLYFYSVLKANILYLNQTLTYNSYHMYIKGFMITDYSLFYDWFTYYNYNNYYKKSYMNVYNDSLDTFLKIRFTSFESIYKNSKHSYIMYLKYVMIYIFFNLNIKNFYISKLWLSHHFLSF